MTSGMSAACLICHHAPFSFHQLSERMKIVDVLGARVFKDGELIITQVQCRETGCMYNLFKKK